MARFLAKITKISRWGATVELFRRLENPTPALKEIGIYLTSMAMKSFNLQGRKKKWPPRGVPNLAGIIKDLRGGGGIKKKRFDARPRGVDTGRLRNSITWKVIGKSSVVWGTNVPYAWVIQFGDRVKLENPIPKMIDKNRRVQKEISTLGKKFPQAANVLRTKEKISITVPASPFLVFLSTDTKVVRGILTSHIKGDK